MATTSVSERREQQAGHELEGPLPVLIVVTRLRLSHPRHRDAFLRAAASAIEQAADAPGNLGTEVLPQGNDVYWTRTAWSDRDAMVSFMTTEPHLGTMANLDEWCDEASFVEWEQPTPMFPEWTTAYDRLIRDGRSPTLNQPSPDHVTRSFAPLTANGT